MRIVLRRISVSLKFASQFEFCYSLFVIVIVCRKELEKFLFNSKGRMRLHYTLSPAVVRHSRLHRAVRRVSSRFLANDSGDNWQYSRGHIDAPMMRKHLPPPGPDSLILICGPDGLIHNTAKPGLVSIMLLIALLFRGANLTSLLLLDTTRLGRREAARRVLIHSIHLRPILFTIVLVWTFFIIGTRSHCICNGSLPCLLPLYLLITFCLPHCYCLLLHYYYYTHPLVITLAARYRTVPHIHHEIHYLSRAKAFNR